MPGQSGYENKLPVFTTPQQQITFYADDTSTHKQILTIFNPYDFPVKFRISSTDCSKYTVSASQGTIKSNHSVDVILQHKAITPANFGASDKIRVQLFGVGQVRAAGKKDINITLLASVPKERTTDPSSEAECFQQLEADAAIHGHLRQNPFNHRRNTTKIQILLVVIIILLVILWLPDNIEQYPWCLLPKLSPESKYTVAVVLGMCIITFFYS
ncbi:motile sperm domain-containing protein 1-like [Stegodyphus dumicola]|uniref:motile sperm domain-containing protein 1-like n=1 Tax=Stegodyphus dumicola TaxID=202533 RepID=UPI0015B18542|nr:motile sperm domain-containing protein 1-like [Stegodyphus dumicola]XP_035221852.1 motile sperm domain-containing protein 1-like [Stegodyphus dumicola]